MQLTRMSLADVIKKAEGQQAGTVYSAIPALQGGRPVVDVLVPRLFYMHFWANDDAVKLAKILRGAGDATNSAK